MAVVVALVLIAVVGLATLRWFPTGTGRERTGSLQRETRRNDATAATHAPSNREAARRAEKAGRERAGETRALPARMASKPELSAGRNDPISEEELGVSRRSFLNRGIFALVGFSLAGFGAASLGFVWPTGASGFGDKIAAGSIEDIVNYIDSHEAPFYVPAARGYVVTYPRSDLPAAKKVYSAVTYAGMEQGFVALYQRCPHLGCRVPFCQTSQWFECPCHGSKYNRVGEKKAGPAPRGMDRFAVTISAGRLTINTGDIELGPPIGTDTTGQQQEGPLCV